MVAIYPNIPHDFGLATLRAVLEKRDAKIVSADTFLDLAELVLSNNHLGHKGNPK